MPKGRYIDLGVQRVGSSGVRLVDDTDGKLFLEHRDENSKPEGHRERFYVFTRAVKLRFTRSGSQSSVNVGDQDGGICYEFPAGSMIYRSKRGRCYEVVYPERDRSVVIERREGVFVFSSSHGFGSSGNAAQSKGFTSGKRHRASGHL